MCSSFETQANFSNPAVTRKVVIIQIAISGDRENYRLINYCEKCSAKQLLALPGFEYLAGAVLLKSAADQFPVEP
jgi:hypothetical protein